MRLGDWPAGDLACVNVEPVAQVFVGHERAFQAHIGKGPREWQRRVVQGEGRGPGHGSWHVGDAVVHDAAIDVRRVRMRSVAMISDPPWSIAASTITEPASWSRACLAPSFVAAAGHQHGADQESERLTISAIAPASEDRADAGAKMEGIAAGFGLRSTTVTLRPCQGRSRMRPRRHRRDMTSPPGPPVRRRVAHPRRRLPSPASTDLCRDGSHLRHRVKEQAAGVGGYSLIGDAAGADLMRFQVWVSSGAGTGR